MKVKIMKCLAGGMLSSLLMVACNSSKDVERMPDDHETVMNTAATATTPLGHDTTRNDSVRFPPPGIPDTSHLPPRK